MRLRRISGFSMQGLEYGMADMMEAVSTEIATFAA
jgi:hypothetical protein